MHFLLYFNHIICVEGILYLGFHFFFGHDCHCLAIGDFYMSRIFEAGSHILILG